jgi:hypothetical protein
MTPDRPDVLRLPATCGVAFKEWAGICDALVSGRQSLIVRKGGIAEGPRGFAPEHDTFWLYPTHVHEAEQGLRETPSAPKPQTGPGPMPSPLPPETVALRGLAVVDSIAFVDREEVLSALRDLHAWTDETLSKRFHYRRPGLWVLGVRVFRRPDPHIVALTAEHAGCKTWVPLDPPPETDGSEPVLDEAEFARRREQLEAALG